MAKFLVWLVTLARLSSARTSRQTVPQSSRTGNFPALYVRRLSADPRLRCSKTQTQSESINHYGRRPTPAQLGPGLFAFRATSA